jgi:hypothetical protein
MNGYPNPTMLRVGVGGRLSGIWYRVLGRVVMGVHAVGETHYWQEFNMVDESGTNATLVYEDGEWKLFVLFDPPRPITAREAASKQIGDIINVDDRPVEITVISQSRVYYIEGEAPEGVEVGDVANYFNAGGGMDMLVVSWTGDEVEFYRGMELEETEVPQAFGLSKAASAIEYTPEVEEATRTFDWIGPLFVLITMAVIGYLIYLHQAPRLPKLPAKLPTHVAILSVGATGTIAGTQYNVTGRSIVAIDRTGSRYDWHEYYLQDAAGALAMLVGGLNLGSNEWFLLRPIELADSLKPRQAATFRRGSPVQLGEHELWFVDALFARAGARERFGFIARSTNETAVVRWNEDAIEVFVGGKVPEAEVLTAFRRR